ncbi:MAG: lytic murein transglycosylase [Endozoicomonas sp. (ex Botrylloides leachii)]|nr:lytic murein transglycosylase [Endozoicomonas sp. (ex Botrylloides leachii)]
MLNVILFMSLLVCSFSASACDNFQQCLLRLEETALKAGISKKTINEGLKTAQFLPKVISTDRHQPEFNETFYQYLQHAVSDKRIAKAVSMMKSYELLLNQLKKRYGIPPHILTAIFGLESNFGSNIGKTNILNALTTLSCDNRRSLFFTKELISALKLMDMYGFSKESMVGSWAGAIGYTQFMPSNYLGYALSSDNRSPPDLWRKISDALASTANYLNKKGWKSGWIWGKEITLPKSFDYRMTGLKSSKKLNIWQKLGVRNADNSNMPEYDISGSVLVPGGHHNPAFIVYDNFHVLLRWNRSIFYAIAVGYLADRINGKPPFKKAIQNDPPLSVVQIQLLQKKLNALGYACGKEDGMLGTETQQGITTFQYANHMIADGFPRVAVLKSLGISR